MDPAALRADMPALERCTYFNTGASGPSPRRVVDAGVDFLEEHAYEAPAGKGPYATAWDAIDAARERVATHVGAAPHEIAFTRSTADGLNLIADAVDWQPGDVVVRTDLEHPAGVLPWERLADVADVDVRVVETEDGRIVEESLLDAVEGARLVVLSSLTWSHGTRLDVEGVVDVAHDAGAQVAVDAVQSIGQHPVDVESWGADFVAMAGHKWLLGPWGAGVLYVADDAWHRLAPKRIGYRGVEDPSATEYAYRAGARRLEVGTTSPVPYVGLAAAVRTTEAVGYDAITDRIEELTDRLKAGVGSALVSPRDYESGLVTIDVDDPAAVASRCRERGVVIRDLPFPEAVRASVHAFNTAEEVDELLAILRDEGAI